MLRNASRSVQPFLERRECLCETRQILCSPLPVQWDLMPMNHRRMCLILRDQSFGRLNPRNNGGVLEGKAVAAGSEEDLGLNRTI